MKRFKVAFTALCGILAAFALSIGAASASAHCMIFYHQPKVPQGMSKYK